MFILTPTDLCKLEDIISHEQDILQNPQRNPILKIQCGQPQFPYPTLSTTITDHLLRSNSIRILLSEHTTVVTSDAVFLSSDDRKRAHSFPTKTLENSSIEFTGFPETLETIETFVEEQS